MKVEKKPFIIKCNNLALANTQKSDGKYEEKISENQLEIF
jgi:hypothetical protein